MDLGTPVTMGQLLEFEVAFPGEPRYSVEYYLMGGSKELILNTAAFFLGFRNQRSRYAGTREFLTMYFRGANQELASQIYHRIHEFEKAGVTIGIINAYSSLKLFEIFFNRKSEQETQTDKEFEVSMFKAYLVLNSEFTERQKIAFPSSQNSDDKLRVPMSMFCMHYPIADKTNFDILQIWVTQLIKAIYLFQFLEVNAKTQPLLEAFLKYFNCISWQDYLKRLVPLTLQAIDGDKEEAHTDIIVPVGTEFEENCSFIEKLIVQENDEFDKNDFLEVRAKPFYKVKDGVYRVIFNLFVVEKIFKGVYFLLRDINKNLPEGKKINEFRSFYGDEFSEKTLCYRVLESIYHEKCIRFSGKQLSDLRIDGAPDYYFRKGKNILLFESKDFLITAEKKMSFDYNVYEAEFGRVLDFEVLPNEKIKPKAILQLVKNIRKILQKQFPADTDYYYRDIFIYPILLTHDLQYDTPGFNELLDYWFQDALTELKNEGLFIYHVKPLSVVNIDAIIYNQVNLDKDISLHEMLRHYHDNKKISKIKKKPKSREEQDLMLKEFGQQVMSKLLPFSLFIDRFLRTKGLWKYPPLIDIVAPTLFAQADVNQRDN